MFSQSGFSLLEMMLVVLILSTLAFSAIDIVDNKDNQVRFEDTRRRLDLIRRAVIGETGAVYNGQRLLSGYSADNGLLPDDIQGLLMKPTDFDSYELKNPIFDPKPDAVTGINDDAGIPLSASGEQLFKGYRGGSYLTSPPGTVVAFYDGWNVAALPNYGWKVNDPTPPPATFTVKSLGADGGIGGTGVYDADISTELSPDDWQVNVDGWGVTIRNQSSTDLAVAAPGCVRASLLTYINDPDQANPFNWKRLTSACIVGNVAVGSDGSCLDGTDADTTVGGSPCATSVQVIFPPPGGFQPPTLIPGGEHLLVLVVDDDGTPHTDVTPPVGEQPCVINPAVAAPKNCTDATGNRTTSPVTFFPRVARPTATLVIR